MRGVFWVLAGQNSILDSMSKDETIAVDGAKVAAQILSRFPAEERERIVESIRAESPEAAIKIEKIIVQHAPPVSLEQITKLDDREVQRLLRQVAHNDVVISLKTAPAEVREKILSNVSETRQQQIAEDFHELPKMQVSDVEAAQQRILRKLEELYPETDQPAPAPTRRLRSRLA